MNFLLTNLSNNVDDLRCGPGPFNIVINSRGVPIQAISKSSDASNGKETRLRIEPQYSNPSLLSLSFN